MLYYNLGGNRFVLLDYIGAIGFYNKSSEEYTKLNIAKKYNYILSRILFNIALCHKKLSNYEKAISYIQDSVDLYDFKNDLDIYVHRKSIEANCWMRLGDLDKSINIHKELVQYIKYIHDGEPRGMLKVEDRLTKLEKSKIAYVYNNLANVLALKKDCSQALDYFNESEKIRREIEPETLSRTIVEKAKLYFSNNMFDESMTSVNIALQNAIDNNDYEYILQCYDLLIKLYKQQNNNQSVEETLEKEYSVLIEIGKYKDAIKINNALLTLYTDRNYSKGMSWCRNNTSELLEFL